MTGGNKTSLALYSAMSAAPVELPGRSQVRMSPKTGCNINACSTDMNENWH